MGSRAQRIRAKGKTAFVILRERVFTVQCVLTEQDGVVSRPMLKYVAGLSRESIVDVEGVVSVPGITINNGVRIFSKVQHLLIETLR